MADLDPVVAAALERIRPGLREQETRRKAYDTAYEVYRATPKANKNRLNWQSRLRVPYAMQVIDTAIVNIVSGAPRVVVSPRRPEFEMGSKAMQLVMDYYIADDHVVEKQPVFVQQALIYGATAAKNHWLYREQNQTIKQIANPFDQTQPGQQTTQMRVITHDRPTFEPWDIYRVYWDPSGTDVDSCAYVVLQSYLSADDLRRLAFNPDTGLGIYHNVEALIASGNRQQETSAQAQRLGLSDERLKGKFLVEEIWTDDSVTVIGNQQVLMRSQENPYWHRRKPIVVTQTRPDVFELQGIPETELVDHIQQAMWTLQNLTIDQLHLTAMRGITYREGGVLDPDSLVLEPRFKWPVSDHDDIRPFEVPPVASDVFTERGRLLSDMQLVTGINPYVSGSDLASVDQNTATGITALQEVASRLLRFKASQIHFKGYQRSYEMWGQMVQQFMDKALAVKIVGPGGDVTWLDVTPEDVQGEFDFKLEGTEESLSRQQERGEAVALLNAFAPLAPLGIVNLKPILEKIAVAYDFPNPDALINGPAQQPPPAAPLPPGAAPGSPGGLPMPDSPLLNGGALPPQVLQAIHAGR